MVRYVIGFCLALAGLAATGWTIAMEPLSDRVFLPPERREFASPDSRFVLIVATADNWKTPRGALAELYQVGEAGRKLAWARHLPHFYGPRRVLISDRGEILLLDDWINALSRHAITVIDPGNRILATYSTRQVFTALAVPLREISATAKAGPWITDGPFLSPDGRGALIRAGGRILEVGLSDGKLVVHDH